MIIKNDFDPQCITYSQMNMIFNARIYYRRLTTWTRAYLISRYFGIGTAEELFGRLYLESLEIGDMLQVIFGRVISEQYSQLSSQYAIELRDMVSSQLAGNTEELSQNVNRLYQNVAERAVFLEEINPYWSEREYNNLLGTYTQYIIEEANALAARDFNKDLEIHDRLTAHTNRMGDTFAEGLYNYITSDRQLVDNPESEVDVNCITYDQMNLVYESRMFWFEMVIWIRNYMLSRYKELGNSEVVFARIRQVPVEYISALKPIFGEKVTDDYVTLFYTYFDLLEALITAQMENNTEEINRITKLLYQNADERAAFVASLNPFWEESEWRDRLYINLRSTLDETTTLLAGDYARNIDIFSRLLDQAESTSNYFAQGLFRFLNPPKQGN